MGWHLVALSEHVKVWMSCVLFEAEAIPLPTAERQEEEEGEDEEKEAKMVPEEPTLAQQVFERGYKDPLLSHQENILFALYHS